MDNVRIVHQVNGDAEINAVDRTFIAQVVHAFVPKFVNAVKIAAVSMNSVTVMEIVSPTVTRSPNAVFTAAARIKYALIIRANRVLIVVKLVMENVVLQIMCVRMDFAFVLRIDNAMINAAHQDNFVTPILPNAFIPVPVASLPVDFSVANLEKFVPMESVLPAQAGNQVVMGHVAEEIKYATIITIVPVPTLAVLTAVNPVNSVPKMENV